VLWERIDARLGERHDLSLAFFEALYFTSQAPQSTLRVGDLAKAMRITVGGASKLVDRVEAAGLIARAPDPTDRRAARVRLTRAGERKLSSAIETYEQEVATVFDRVLSSNERRRLDDYVARLLAEAEGARS
jgi:DNA-binding MarR family transcriptional regulator